MSEHIFIINGPNLNLLGQREPHIYGAETLKDVEASCRKICESFGAELSFFQSNYEGQMVEWIHEAREKATGLVINPAAYSHTSIALYDALKMFDPQIMEVHISNIHKREAFRHHSYVSEVADAVIAGMGVRGYEYAVQHLLEKK